VTAERALERSEHGAVERDGVTVAYYVVRSARRRRTIELTLEPDGVRVAAPLRTPAGEIAEFVRDRIPWIRKHRQRTAQAPHRERLSYVDGESLPYLGRWLPIDVIPGGRRVRVELDLLGLRITVPGRYEDDVRKHAVEVALHDWYRRHANEEIKHRVEAWARLAGYPPRRVLVRDQRRRWGSCSPDGTLRFNWRLVMMSPRLIDYVIVHELAHLIRPHHRPSFWAEVGRLLPDYAARRSELRDTGATLPL